MLDDGKDYGAQMRAARERLGLTQAQVASKVGVTGTTISNWENGKSAPEAPQRVSLDAILDLADLGGTSLGKRIQSARVRAALSQSALAKRIEFAQPTV